MNKHHSMTWFEWTMLTGLSIIWGGSFFFIALSAKELPSFTIVFLRVALASLMLWPVLMSDKQCYPFLTHHLGSTPYCQRFGIHSKCDHSIFYSPTSPFFNERRAYQQKPAFRSCNWIFRSCPDSRAGLCRRSECKQPSTTRCFRSGLFVWSCDRLRAKV